MRFGKLTVVKALILILTATLAAMTAEVLDAIQQPLIPFRNPSREPRLFGDHGQGIKYVVLGDSTGAGQGAENGGDIATQTAIRLADTHRVTLFNLAISGARIHDVLTEQLPHADALKPDLVLIAVGANDSTHFTASSQFSEDLDLTLAKLQLTNPGVKIVATGCPYMGSVPRFAQPLRWFAGTQGRRINDALVPILIRHGVVYADIDHTTGPAFAKDPTLFAADRFHPNNRGYALWVDVLNKAIAKALS